MTTTIAIHRAVSANTSVASCPVYEVFCVLYCVLWTVINDNDKKTEYKQGNISTEVCF